MDILFPKELMIDAQGVDCIPRELASVNCGDLCWFVELIKYFANLGIWMTGSPYYGAYIGIMIPFLILYLAGIAIGLVLNYLETKIKQYFF